MKTQSATCKPASCQPLHAGQASRVLRLAMVCALSVSLAAIVTAGSAETATAAGSAVPAVTTCIACHGAKGEGNTAAGYPRLAGLPADYIAAQLQSFAQGTRANSLMAPMAKALSDGQIIALAHDYSSLKPPVAAYGPMPAVAQAELGQRLAERGDWAAGIASCFRCHGPGGVGVAPSFPPLIGQSAGYIEAQIKAWKDGSRHNDPQDLMHTIALRLTDADTQAVAAWLAAQKPPASTPRHASAQRH